MTHFGRAVSLVIVVVVFCLGSLISAQGGTGSISGVITEADGVTPISGVRVYLDSVDINPQFFQLWTGANGIYQFPGVTPGIYVLCAEHTRYVSTCHDGKRGTRSADAITIAADDALTNVIVRMPRRASISGRVFAPNGSGVKTQLGVWENPALLTPQATTSEPNADGTFTIYVDPGTFTISAHHTTYGRVFYGGALTRAEAAQISVGVGDVLSGIYIYYAAPGSITGTITEADPAGDSPVPIPNATVALYRQSSGIAYASTLTDAAGVYHFFNVPNDVFRLTASAQGYVPEIYNDAPSLGYASYIVAEPAPAIQTVNLQLERTGDVTGRLYEPDGVTPLANRRMMWQSDFTSGITFCSDAAGDYTISDAPLNRLFYVFMDGFRCDNATPIYKAEYWDDSTSMTNAVPLWVNETTPLTGINFVAAPTGYASPLSSGGTGDSGEGGRTALTGSIGGAIYAPDGVTTLRGWVDLYRVEGGSTTRVRGMGVESSGQYWFQALPPGTYKLRVKPEGYLSEYYPDAASLDDAATLTVVAGEEMRQINFIVNPGVILTGTVYDSATGLPALYPELRVVDTSGQEVEWGGRANDDGTYQVVVPPGLYAIFADNTTYGAGRFYGGAVRLEDAAYVEAVEDLPVSGLDITLGRRGEVTGTVYAPDGVTGVANVSVRVSQPGNPFSYTTCTNSRGIYRHTKAMLDVPNLVSVEGYCDGSPIPYLTEYWEDVHHAGGATPVMVHDRQRYATGINFTLEPGGSISGTITGGALPGSEDDPVLLSNAVVSVYAVHSDVFTQNAAEVIATTSTNPDGTYTISGLPPGLYRVMATTPGYVQEYYQERFSYQTAPSVMVSEGVTTTGIDIEIDPAMTVSGTVTEMDGVTPIANIPVYFVANGYEIIFFCTGTNGQYTIDIAPTNAVFRVYPLWEPPPDEPIPCDSELNHYRDPKDPNSFDAYYYAPDAEPLTLNFALEAAGRVAGRLTQTDGVTPISGANIAIYAPGEPYPLYVQTDDNGNYISFALLPGNGYRVGVEPFGRVQEAFYGGENYASAEEVTVTAGATTSNIDIEAPYLTGTSSLSGIALAGDGITPLHPVQVTLYDAAKGYFDVTTTDSSGTFSFASIPSSTYYLDAYHAQYPREYYQNQASINALTPINVDGSVTGIEIAFDGVSSISGTIYDELTGLPMPFVRVDVDGPGGTTTVSDVNGAYTTYLAAPGSYAIYAISLYDSASGIYRNPLEEDETQVIVNDGEYLTGLDIFLPRTGEIVGSVTDAGIGLNCVSVSAYRIDMSASYGASTNANGQYWLSFPLTDSYLATAAPSIIDCGSDNYISEWWQEAPNAELATPITLDYKNRVRTGIDFTLVPIGTPVTLNGSVTVAGRPDIPVQVVITPDAGGAAVYDQTVQTDEDGMFTVSGIEPGRYQVWVKGEATLAVTRTVTLAAGPTAVDFGLLRLGDANGDNQIGLNDFSILASSFGKQEGDEGYDARADFNGDGVINLIDFSLLASNFGQAGAAG